ncbi:MAG: hypothetical protein AAGA77_01530 [Bacteroidota bacterium]
MTAERYLEIRNCQKSFVYEIADTDNSGRKGILRAAKQLGFLENETIVFEDEEESNVLMDYMLYEKNGRSNRLVDRFLKQNDEPLDDLRKLILNGMINNYYSVFEIKQIDVDQSNVILFDLISKKEYILMDFGFSSTASLGTLLATRIIPCEDVFVTSGLSFAFNSHHRLRILTTISRQKDKHRRPASKKSKSNKSNSKTMFEIMFNLHKQYGLYITTQAFS